MHRAPILVSVYHREEKFKKCIDALKRNRLACESHLIVVSDGAFVPEHQPIIDRIRTYVRSISGFASVHLIARQTNYGAHRSVTEAVEFVFSKWDRLIFLEDDIVVGEDFLEYLNSGLDFFEGNKRIFAVCAYKRPFKMLKTYPHDIYFLENYSPWGFGIWRDRYNKVDLTRFNRYEALSQNRELFDFIQKTEPGFLKILRSDSNGNLTAMDVRFEYHIHMNRLLSVFPSVSRSTNHGFDQQGMHCSGMNAVFDVPLSCESGSINYDIPIVVDPEVQRRFFKAAKPPLWLRAYKNIAYYGWRETLEFYMARFMAKCAKRR